MIMTTTTLTLTPIALAVAPLKLEAMNRAEIAITARIERARDELEAAGWDLEKLAPYPSGRLGRREYKQQLAMRNFYERVTTWTVSSRRPCDPDIRKWSPEGVQRMITNAREMAASTYELFVHKLETKVGEHTSAALHGSSVWGHSILDVQTPNGPQRWITKQILNVSVLGLLFNQWPTRLAK